MMNGYDLAVSMDEATINSLLAQTFGLSRLAGLFTGTMTQEIAGVTATVTWTVQQAPQIGLTAPTSTQWNQAIDSQGGNPEAVPNAGILSLPALNIQYTYGGATGGTTLPATAIWTWSMSGGSLTLAPLAAIVDTSGMSSTEQTIVSFVVLPLVMEQAGTYTKTIALPTIDQYGASFGTPNFNIADDRLIMVAAVTGEPAPAVPDASVLPSDPLFIQISQRALQNALNNALTQTYSFNGNKFTADYTGTVSAVGSSLAVSATDPTQITGTLDYQLTCSATVLDGSCGVSAAASAM